MKQWFVTNTVLKIFALALAVIAWFFVRGITSETRTVENVPLEVRLRPGHTLVQSSAATVTIALRGTREDIRQVTRAEVAAVLDLHNEHRTGTWTERLGPKTIRHPPRVQVVQVAPAGVTVTVDEVVERTVPVKPQLTGEVPTGFTVERTNVVPAEVRVRGPKARAEALAGIETLPIDLSWRRVSFRERVHLALPHPSLTVVSQPWVEADVRIAEATR
jgi:YbbR domain-containing protein